MAAKETKTEAVETEKPTTRGATSGEAAAPEITQEMIAERAYHISQSGEGGTDEENWHRAEAELRQGS
jgi:fibronectin type 3 domain-containing protein